MRVVLSDIQVDLPGRSLFQIPSLRIESGESLLISGPSGAGKTTLLHLIAGLFSPARGTVEVGETALGTLSEGGKAAFRAKHVGVVFQRLNLIESFTAEENVRLALKGVDGAAERAREALTSVGLGGRGNELARTFSLGEQQRIAVARVLARRPDLILADEPTSSLDDDNARTVIDLLRKASEGKTLLVVSHDHRIENAFAKRRDFRELVRR